MARALSHKLLNPLFKLGTKGRIKLTPALTSAGCNFYSRSEQLLLVCSNVIIINSSGSSGSVMGGGGSATDKVSMLDNGQRIIYCWLVKAKSNQ